MNLFYVIKSFDFVFWYWKNYRDILMFLILLLPTVPHLGVAMVSNPLCFLIIKLFLGEWTNSVLKNQLKMFVIHNFVHL